MTYTDNPSTGARRRQQRGERGIAIALTGLLLIPMLVFAAFGVDLASWYARISELQRGADAAALAGAVWMPNLSEAQAQAEASLRSNGLHNDQDPMVTHVIERGSTVTSLRVTLTDNDADRHFSQIFIDGPAELSRYAEAEYNLPLPLGSPLNYFGGDSTRTEIPPVDSWSATWPLDYATRAPANPSCNVGTSSGQGLGRWTSGSPPTYSASGFSGSTRCVWTVAGAPSSGNSAVPPPDYFSRQPNNVQCRVRVNGTGATIGAWVNGPTRYIHESAGGLSTGTASCSWANMTTTAASVPTFATSLAPNNRPCRVGYETSLGWWPATGAHSTASVPVGGRSNQGLAGNTSGTLVNTGNQLCRWSASVVNNPIITPNPIDPSRSPGFWAAIEGPQTRAYQGDIYSTRCYTSSSCSTVQNVQYQDSASTDRGTWYVMRIPPGLTGTVDVNVFDASYVTGSTEVRAGDRSLDGGGTFSTQYQVYQQNNALDFSQRTAQFSGASNTTEGSCNWLLGTQPEFSGQWRRLCTISSVTPGQIYLINVQTPGTTGAGVNGYSLEAVANGSHTGVQPSLYAYSHMTMQNNNFCGGTSGVSCPPPPATFYLAEVGPQYAGRILVMELWDSGDVGAGTTAVMTPMMPSSSQPRPVTPVPASICTYTSTVSPNGAISGTTGSQFSTPQSSAHATECQIQTSTSGTSHFNGVWLQFRVEIPTTYTCTLGANPETTAGSCWWGIRYNFTGSANDVTTWQARIEGNPLQLTQ